MPLRISIDRDLCMGSGHCLFTAPGVFDLDDDSVAVVLDPGAAPADQVLAAAQKCPTHAISVESVEEPD